MWSTYEEKQFIKQLGRYSTVETTRRILLNRLIYVYTHLRKKWGNINKQEVIKYAIKERDNCGLNK